MTKLHEKYYTRKIDKYVGKKLYSLRIGKNLTQEQLALAVGVSFQQIQKYEKGANRIGASRLFQFSRVLKVPIHEFFPPKKYMRLPQKDPKNHKEGKILKNFRRNPHHIQNLLLRLSETTLNCMKTVLQTSLWKD